MEAIPVQINAKLLQSLMIKLCHKTSKRAGHEVSCSILCLLPPTGLLIP